MRHLQWVGVQEVVELGHQCIDIPAWAFGPDSPIGFGVENLLRAPSGSRLAIGKGPRECWVARITGGLGFGWPEACRRLRDQSARDRRIDKCFFLGYGLCRGDWLAYRRCEGRGGGRDGLLLLSAVRGFQIAPHDHLELWTRRFGANDLETDIWKAVGMRELDDLVLERGQGALTSTLLMQSFEADGEAFSTVSTGMFATGAVKPFAKTARDLKIEWRDGKDVPLVHNAVEEPFRQRDLHAQRPLRSFIDQVGIAVDPREGRFAGFGIGPNVRLDRRCLKAVEGLQEAFVGTAADAPANALEHVTRLNPDRR